MIILKFIYISLIYILKSIFFNVTLDAAFSINLNFLFLLIQSSLQTLNNRKKYDKQTQMFLNAKIKKIYDSFNLLKSKNYFLACCNSQSLSLTVKFNLSISSERYWMELRSCRKEQHMDSISLNLQLLSCSSFCFVASCTCSLSKS